MIQTELLKDGTLIRHYSDSGMMLIQNETGIEYFEAVDVVPCKYTYSETTNPIEDASEEISAEEALNIITGGAGV